MSQTEHFFFTPEEEKQIGEAIRQAELKTSGEIRVRVEHDDDGDAYKRAIRVFEKLGMTKTDRRNGVLFYLSTDNHHFAVVGDSGIHGKVGEAFWQNIRDTMIPFFKEGHGADGLCAGIRVCGEALQKHFPIQDDDENELPNTISQGEL